MELFDRAIIYRNLNMNRSYMQIYPVGICPYLNFIAYCILMEIPEKEIQNQKSNFIKYMLKNSFSLDEEEVLDTIIKSEIDSQLKKAYIELLYSEEGAPFLDRETEEEYEKKYKEQKDSIKEKVLIERLLTDDNFLNIFGMKMDKDLIKKIHINYFNPRGLSMFFMETHGIFLSIGIKSVPPEKEDITLDTVGDFLKTAGDNTRFEIIKSLNLGEPTSTEISKEVGVSLSTVNYHLKQLISSHIAEVCLPSKSGKGETYTLNRKNIINILDYFRFIIESKTME